MNEVYVDVGKKAPEMFRGVLRRIYAAMPSSCASKTNHKVRESSLSEALHVVCDNRVHVIEEGGYLAVFFKEFYHRCVQPGQLFVLVIFARVVS